MYHPHSSTIISNICDLDVKPSDQNRMKTSRGSDNPDWMLTWRIGSSPDGFNCFRQLRDKRRRKAALGLSSYSDSPWRIDSKVTSFYAHSYWCIEFTNWNCRQWSPYSIFWTPLIKRPLLNHGLEPHTYRWKRTSLGIRDKFHNFP